MHPFPRIRISGTGRFLDTEEIKISVVNTNDKEPPLAGSCPCHSCTPILKESKSTDLFSRNNETFCKIQGGLLE